MPSQSYKCYKKLLQRLYLCLKQDSVKKKLTNLIPGPLRYRILFLLCAASSLDAILNIYQNAQ